MLSSFQRQLRSHIPSAGFIITYMSRQLDARHPANWKLLTLLAAANNITIGLLYQHQPGSVCGSTVAKVTADQRCSMDARPHCCRRTCIALRSCLPGNAGFRSWGVVPMLSMWQQTRRSCTAAALGGTCHRVQVLLASFGAVPVLGALLKQLVKGGAGSKRRFGAEAYKQEFLPSGAMAHSGQSDRHYK
jgi:hypothetical protein